ncbi:hypothetical protein [Azospirillum argentinense]|uniref:Uncharacterized protein n=1 Tax=Azospirillum brasilense TaxID=192 RepID=A0A4D8QGJ7_AZOBR|nr:hypothetical protein [Azospirillum argentinense]QCO07350.1 hypothetical protein D3867_36340 [Azospirillum argentinense]
MAEPATPTHVILPAASLWTILHHAEKEHERLSTWLELGAHPSFGQDATDLATAITLAVRTLTHGPGGSSIALPVLTAATLRYYATREIARLVGMGAWFADADLDRQAAELKEALGKIPYTLRKEEAPVVPPSAAIHTAASRGEAAHG